MQPQGRPQKKFVQQKLQGVGKAFYLDLCCVRVLFVRNSLRIMKMCVVSCGGGPSNFRSRAHKQLLMNHSPTTFELLKTIETAVVAALAPRSVPVRPARLAYARSESKPVSGSSFQKKPKSMDVRREEGSFRPRMSTWTENYGIL